ncbi:MAG: carbohydrate deacetylase [Desulfosudaceae bacterium]
MKLLVNADDFGLTRSGTDTILQCLDDGLLNGVSLVPNGADFDYAVDALKKRRGVSLGIHLNLVEGRPVSPAEEVPWLIGESGCFRHGFGGLWRALSLAGKMKQEEMRRQVGLEIRAQIEKCRPAARDCPFPRLDSHMYVHMIPAVFELVCECLASYDIGYVRIPHERLASAPAAARLLTINGVKRTLLHMLSIPARKKLDSRAILYCRRFAGILYSGKMDRLELSAMLNRFSGQPGVMEVIFHPGGATPAEARSADIRFANFYLSPARSREALALRSLKSYIVPFTAEEGGWN